MKNPQIEPGDQVLVMAWQEKGSPSQVSKKWTRPYQVVLVTLTTVTMKGLSAWVHISRKKTHGLQNEEMGTKTTKPQDNYSYETVEVLRLLFRQKPIKSPSDK